ncbi:MAG: class I SAM-dependent rRNA methyltransferase [Planctomycetota bacterium]|jgi:23S rRNA (cytosine1962-C5)-methyltransferase|nr:MAG: class I SAM-dependent rRNA methyltransferase [Planctomycetota bacterium]
MPDDGLPTATVVLKPKRARPFFGRHPWVLDSAVLRVEGDPADGDVVELATHDGTFVGRGLWNSASRLRVRLYAFDATTRLDADLWRQRLEAAIALRRSLGLDDRTGACRLVNSEGDDLSGLIVDRYGEHLAVQVTALAMARRLEEICDVLQALVAPAGILLRGAERGLAKLEGLHLADRLVRGTAPAGPVFVHEHGLRFGIDLAEGQKTGFYLDQRDNRQAVARFARGRRVLDMFCYSGGFSVTCATTGGARSVLAVDSSAKATALAKANADLNGAASVTVEKADAFEKLASLAAADERFGLVILDPPKFSRSRATLDDALRAYHRINRAAVDLLEPGGILATCSCSGSVAREDFLQMLAGVAQRAGRPLQLLECRGAAADHPVSVSCLEGEYLKCVIARVA